MAHTRAVAHTLVVELDVALEQRVGLAQDDRWPLVVALSLDMALGTVVARRLVGPLALDAELALDVAVGVELAREHELGMAVL